MEKKGISNYLVDALPQLVVEGGDTALTVLSVCIGGMISMMVFSFSMVMLLLSQASSNFSPRILPGLISDKRHQIILGVYLATIIYCIFTMFSIEPSGEKYTLPGFSVLLGIVFTIGCLCSFIYFIHNMSESIQISNILDDIYEEANSRLKFILKKEKELQSVSNFDDTTNWHFYNSRQSGYFQDLTTKNMISFCKENETRLFIIIPKGLYVFENSIFFASEKPLSDEQLNSFNSHITFSKRELVRVNYGLAFKQITEIAVKAMSPGINDPGTAVNAIDYLTELFALRMKKKDIEIYVDADKIPWFKLETIKFKELIYNVMASLRTYCKHDPIIVQKLLYMLNYLLEQPYESKEYKKALKAEIKHLKRDSRAIIKEISRD